MNYREKFIDYNFDNLLIQNNNHLANSYEYYIKPKENYITESEALYKIYNNYDIELSKLLEIQNTILTPFKRVYTFVDTDAIKNLKTNLKNIYLEQQSKFKNFLIYIDYLNKNHEKIKSDEYIQDYVPKRPSSIRSISSIKSFDSVKRTPSIKSLDSSKRRKNIFSKLVSKNATER